MEQDGEEEEEGGLVLQIGKKDDLFLRLVQVLILTLKKVFTKKIFKVLKKEFVHWKTDRWKPN